jgi:hypothetical protein
VPPSRIWSHYPIVSVIEGWTYSCDRSLIQQGVIKVDLMFNLIANLNRGYYYGSADKSLARQLQRRKILIFIYPIYNHNWRNIYTIYIYITRLASNEIFSLSNKTHREVGRTKDLWAPLYYNIHKHASHVCLSWARSIQSLPPLPTSRRFILLLSSHLRLGLPSGLFASCIPTKTLYGEFMDLLRTWWLLRKDSAPCS